MGTHPIFESDFDCLTDYGLKMSDPIQIEPVDPNDPKNWDIVKATQYGVFDRVKEIVEKDGFDVRKPDRDNITVLHWAAINNRSELVHYLLSAGAIVDAIGGDLNSTPLQWAVRQGHQGMVALLLNAGADATIRDGEGNAAIHIAAQFSYWPIVAYLVAKGIDVDTFDTNGLTPLMWAVLRSQGPDTIRVLLALGADPNLTDRRLHNTPLHFAVETPNAGAFDLLIDKTSDLQAENSKGVTPLSMATGKRDWMGEKILSELENRGVRRARGIKRLFATKQRRTGLIFLLSLFFLCSAGFIFDSSSDYLSNWAAKLGALILAYIIMFMTIKIVIPSAETSDKMPICWSEATKLLITLTVLVQVWPVLDAGWFRIITYVVFTPLLHYVFFKTVNGDPGFIKVDQAVQYATVIELAEAEKLDSSSLCTSSLIKRPLRSKFCGTSNRLVAKFDHYCPWVNNAVGAGNHKNFVLYLTLLVINLSWHAVAIVTYWGSPQGCDVNWGSGGALMRSFRCSGWITWVFFHTCAHLVWVFLLLSTQLYFVIVQAITTNERMRAHRYPYLTTQNGQITHNVFDRGILQNFVDFFELPLFGRKPLKIDWRTKLDYGPEFHLPQQTSEIV